MVVRSGLLIGVCALLGILGASAPAAAQSQFSLPLLDRLKSEVEWREGAGTIPNQGTTLYFSDLRRIADGERHTLGLLAPRDDIQWITVLSTCDTDCDDLLVAIYDENNQWVAESGRGYREATVNFQADPARTYYARVAVNRCRERYCYVMTGAFVTDATP